MLTDTFKNCPPVLRSYLRYLETIKNQKPSTLRDRYLDIKVFLQFLKERSGEQTGPAANEVWVEDIDPAVVAGVTEDDINDYLEYLAQQRHVAEVTIYRRKLPSLRKFYDYLIRHQDELGIQITSNPAPNVPPPSSPAKPCRVLSRSEITRLLRAVSGETAVRDTAIVLLMVTTGLSVSEVAKIRYDDYHQDALFVAGRKIFLTENCQDAINRYISDFRDPLTDFLKDNTLFVTQNYRKRLSARGIQNALQKHFDRAGIDASARDLRYTAVIELLKNARNECERSYIAGRLGYSNPQSLNSLPLPKPEKDDILPSLVGNSWLGELGADNN